MHFMEFLLTNIRMWVYWLRVRETYDTRTPACTCIWASLDYSILIPCMGYRWKHIYFMYNFTPIARKCELTAYILLITSHSLIYHHHHCWWRALVTFEQGGIFIVPHLMWHGASVFMRSSPKDRSIWSPWTISKWSEVLFKSWALRNMMRGNQNFYMKWWQHYLQDLSSKTIISMHKQYLFNKCIIMVRRNMTKKSYILRWFWTHVRVIPEM